MAIKETKTFGEWLKEVDRNTMVYVGTKHGSSWLLIETAGDLIDNLEKLEYRLCKEAHLKRATYYEVLEEAPRAIVRCENELDSISDIEDPKVGKLRERIWKLRGEFASAWTGYKKYDRALISWVRLEDRFVNDVVEHYHDIPGIGVLIGGIEAGDKWMKHEKGRFDLT